MALPFRDFTTSTTDMGIMLASKYSASDIGVFYNVAYRRIALSHQWSARYTEGVSVTTSPYTTGTVIATQASQTVTGTGTTWTSGMVGLFLRVGGDNQYYKILTVTPPTTLTIEPAAGYASATQTNVSYEIFGLNYALGTDVGDLIAFPAFQGPLTPRDANWLQIRDPERRSAGGTPSVWIPKGLDANGSFVVEWWPRLSTATAIRFVYEKRTDDLSGTQLPIIRPDLIEALGCYYTCRAAYAKFGDAHWRDMAADYKRDYQELLADALLEDQSRHNLPKSVTAETPQRADWQFQITHDVPVG